MKTIVKAVEPQPIVAKEKNGKRRWIWGPTEPITDMCHGGNSIVSWWDGYGDSDHSIMMEKYCPIERPEKARVECVFDGERWVWIVHVSERDWAKMTAPSRSR